MTFRPEQVYARVAGLLLLVSLVAGGFGEVYVLEKLMISGNAEATGRQLASSGSLLRSAFACYLVEAMCDVALTLIFYVLLRPVSRNLSLLAALFGLMGTATYAIAELFFFLPAILAGNADALGAFSPAQLDAAAFLALRIYGTGSNLFMAFGGAGGIVLGYLIFRSRYLPRTLGLLEVVSGVGFVARNFLLILVPGFASEVLLLPASLAMLALALWLLIKGIDQNKWEEWLSSRTSFSS